MLMEAVQVDEKNRILIVDDDEALRRLIGDFLKGHGYSVFEADGGKAIFQVTDVRNPDHVKSLVDAAEATFGHVHIMVANAGIVSYGSVLQVDPDAFRRVLDINVLGVFHTVRAALPALIERRGYVLVVSSLAAYTACPGLAPYNASKAGVELLADALRLEVAHQGVMVGSAHMSWINTALVRDTQSDLPAFDQLLASFPWPLNKTTTVDKCAAAFVKGIRHRRARVYCPRWVALFRWVKPVLSSRVGEMPLHESTAELLPQLDAQVAALGRSTSAYNRDLSTS